MTQQIACLVLSGGRSSRMGRDKATLDIDGQPLLARQVALLKQLKLPVWVSGQYADYPAIVDDSPAQGPLAGIGSAMRALASQFDALFVIAVDMPLLSVPLLKSLLQKMQGNQACFVADAMFPIWLPNNTQTRQKIAEAENSDNYALKPFLRSLDANIIRCEHPSLLMNTNTPEQWQQALTHLEENHQ